MKLPYVMLCWVKFLCYELSHCSMQIFLQNVKILTLWHIMLQEDGEQA